MLSAIVAMANNNVIGRDNDLLWHLPADLKNFKKLTMNKTLIMGRKTFDSVGVLPGRKAIVLTHEMVPGITKNLTFINNLDKIDDYIYSDEEYFVIGGGQIYSLFLPYVKTLYVTRIYHDFSGDTYFPEITKSDWELKYFENKARNKSNPYNFSFLVYEKIYNEKLCSKNQNRANRLDLECWQTCDFICPNCDNNYK